MTPEEAAGIARELARAGLGWLPHEPRLHVKRGLGAHAYDDARSAVKLERRLGHPGTAPPLPIHAATSAAEYEALAYGTVKPRLAADARALAARLDPLADEPLVHALIQLAARTERHCDELSLPPTQTDDGPHPIPRADRPARDPYIQIADARPDTDHARLNHELLDAERAATEAREVEDADRIADLARAAADHLRRTAVIERDMAGHWGDEPVDLSSW